MDEQGDLEKLQPASEEQEEPGVLCSCGSVSDLNPQV